MEDGDDDISLTADGKNWNDNQGSSENDTVVTKDEEGLSSGEHLVSSTSLREDNSSVSPAKFDDKEELSDQESENRTFGSDTNPVDNSSEFLDENCDEQHNIETSESSPAHAPSEQPASSEANYRIVSQDYISELHEEGERCSEVEGNTFSCVEETENVNSSLGEEEEEKEEEEEHQTSASSEELVSKLPKSYFQSENFEHSEHLNKNNEDFKRSDSQSDKYDERQLKSPNHPNEYDDRHQESPGHSHEEYGDNHLKSPNHPDYDDRQAKSPNHPDEHDGSHVKSPVHSDECNDNFIKSSDDLDHQEYDGQFKSPDHQEEYDGQFKSPDHQEEYEDGHIKSPDHQDEYDRLKSPDEAEHDHLKSSDHEVESDGHVKSPDCENEYDDGCLKSSEPSEEYDGHLKSSNHSDEEDNGDLKSYDQSDEEYSENVQKSNSQSAYNDENLQKSDCLDEYNNESKWKSDSPNEYNNENFRSDDPNDYHLKTSEQLNEEFSNESFKKCDNSGKDDVSIKSLDHVDAEYSDENFKKSDSSNEHSDENFETIHHPNEDDRRAFDRPSEEFRDDNHKKFDDLNDSDEVDKASDYHSEEFGDETLRISDTSYEDGENENFQKQDLSEEGNEKEYNTEQERSDSGPQSGSDLPLENYEDDKEIEFSHNENYKDNCNNAKDVTLFPEDYAHGDNNRDEYDSDERDLVMEVSSANTMQHINAHVEISPRKEEKDVEVDENPIPEPGDPGKGLVSESESTEEQLNLKVDHCPIENELRIMCEESERNDNDSEIEAEQLITNNGESNVDDAAIEFSENAMAREHWVESKRQEEKVTFCNSDKEEEPLGNSLLNSLERSESEEAKRVKVDERESVSEINEQVFEMREIKSPERSDANNKIVCKKPCVLECHSMKQDDHEAVNDDNMCMNEVNSAEKVNETDSVVKVNGEIELINSNLLNDKETSVSSKEKVGLKRKHQTSPTQEISCDISPSESVKGNIQFKGFKKRYIAQVSEVSTKESPDVSLSVQEDLRIKSKRPSKKLILETPQVLVSHQPLPDGAQGNTPLTEYAQYLGLQPTVKFKCYNCGESGFPSMLKLQEHQNVCLKSIRIHTYTKPPPSPIVEPAPSTNFRITRKVYLCSACGTYYENWNLFLHMREVHKRHICLFCLLMFSQADKLAQHLSAKHEIADSSYNTPEQFLNEFKGSFFVMCCTCEQMFSERDNFFDHLCKDTSVVNTDQACSLCGLKGAHFPTCRRAFTDSSSVSSPSQNNSQTAAVNTSTETSQNSQLNIQDKTLSVSKYSVQTDKLTTGRKSLHKLSEQNHDRSDKSHNTGDLDDDYDISDAASYCHVNIHEPDKQKVVGPDENNVSKEGTNDETTIVSEKMDDDDDNDQEQPPEEIQNAGYIMEETAKDNSADDDDDNKSKSIDLISPDDAMEIDRPLPQVAGDNEENRPMEVDEKAETAPHISSNASDAKQTDVQMEPPSVNEIKSPKDGGESESDSSGSGADSRDSDGSSSSSEASSDENEPEEKEPQKTVKSDESDVDKSDSDKMSIVVDEARSEDEGEKQDIAYDDHSNVTENETNEIHEPNNISEESEVKSGEKPTNTTDLGEEPQDNIQIAGDDVPLLELTLEESLDALSIQTVVKECVKISCSTCVYCNHAKKIAVNGKQLVLHLLAEHRFEPVVCSDSGELTPVFGFVDNLKSKLSELQDMYFNTDTYDSADKSFTRPYDRTYECFHCHFITTLHKELYVHNRKMHQKTILLCIMCKSNFYSYSELLCHLCPGIYVPDSNILFRCCLCVVDGLPSAFRLMVHLRKRHHACDVCLETTGDQQKLSNHVWKHKLHHLCYRCGIAYRNKPDITKHLFWKHGTESVLCKKCLQKKWPHVYHFCIPPTAFLCEECNASFTRAVALKVHKRLHADDVPYQCDECEERFISKKLLRRHKEKHKQVILEKEDYKNSEKMNEMETHEMEENGLKTHSAITENDVDKDLKEEDSECAAEKSTVMADTSGGSEAPEEISKEPDEINSIKFHEETKSEKKSKVVDVYDLPPLNLSSESDDSDEETCQTPKQPVKDAECLDNAKTVANENAGETAKSQDGEPPAEEEVQPVQIVDGVWDNFKTYKANLEKREILQAQASGNLVGSSTSLADNSGENHAIVDVVMADHDYCVLPEKQNEDKNTLVNANCTQPLLNIAEEGGETAENLDDKGGGFEADHNYCFNTSPQSEDKKELSAHLPQIPSDPSLQSPPLPVSHPSLPTPPQPTPPASLTSSPKKKQKSPKKKQKQSGSSSSSDSSSNSDSSSCTCGTNCSCSSSSSSSSGSSSSSSDSDSSSSEGRRRQAARRERRRERAKRKLEIGSRGGTPPPAGGLSVSAAEAGSGLNASLETTQTPVQMDSSGAGSLQVDDTPVVAAPEPEENELLIRESDLDTTETETDEDFYDKYPQRQANKLLAEKRNQLLLLAAVAPVNNGTIAQPSPPPPPEVQEPVQKKKGKTKRHKRAQHNNSEKKVESKLKLNIPVSYYNSPSFSVGNTGHPVSPVANSQTPTSSHVSRLHHDTFSPANPEASSTPTAYHSTGSGSETESKRLSKRKRIPKKFYGDSSDEEAEHTPHQPYKWRKVIPASSNTPQVQPTISSGFGYRATSVNVPPPEPVHVQPLSVPEKSDEEDADESDSGHDAKRSSSDSSNSDSDNEQSDADSDVETVTTVTHAVSSVSGNVTQQKNENLYCYCQCPYDEVSEMIACDGKDCSIEWFHFECVGIMVPPKGKWFCPDCRKKTAARAFESARVCWQYGMVIRIIRRDQDYKGERQKQIG